MPSLSVNLRFLSTGYEWSHEGEEWSGASAALISGHGEFAPASVCFCPSPLLSWLLVLHMKKRCALAQFAVELARSFSNAGGVKDCGVFMLALLTPLLGK
jgi:hypothetical protein